MMEKLAELTVSDFFRCYDLLSSVGTYSDRRNPRAVLVMLGIKVASFYQIFDGSQYI
ncbi:hypothetical protein F2Q68_00035163 [Brassica cretica]|uniref:Uncharacterized protein n=1 Tax=Brassica cretica TaxID=69181 RepID=A0A8S9H4S4_BRACR|nr:hypothetical protein F2Q68_00035163 [Brassica cretica]